MSPRLPIIEIAIADAEIGWADVTVRHGRQLVDVGVSDVTNGLGEFAAVVGLVATAAPPGAECRWEQEPGAMSVFVRACGAWPHVEPRVGEDDGIPRGPDFASDFRERLRAVLDVRDLVRDTVAAFDQLRAKFGIDGCQARWGYPYPSVWLDAMVARMHEVATWHHQAAFTHAVVLQALCHARMRGAELAAALGASHDRVVSALRELEGHRRLRREERDGDVHVARGTFADDLLTFIGAICREEWAARPASGDGGTRWQPCSMADLSEASLDKRPPCQVQSC